MKLKLKSLSKATTIIALVFEGLGVLTAFAFGVLLRTRPAIIEFLIEQISAEFAVDSSIVASASNVLGILLLVMGVVFLIVFIVNIKLFSGLIKGTYTLQEGRAILVWQVVWGAINLLFNQLTAALYLISGITGLNQLEIDQRGARESWH